MTPQKTAFETLKTAMTKALVLSLPIFINQFIIQIDTSSTRIGVVLIEEGQPISFFSKKFYAKL